MSRISALSRPCAFAVSSLLKELVQTSSARCSVWCAGVERTGRISSSVTRGRAPPAATPPRSRPDRRRRRARPPSLTPFACPSTPGGGMRTRLNPRSGSVAPASSRQPSSGQLLRRGLFGRGLLRGCLLRGRLPRRGLLPACGILRFPAGRPPPSRTVSALPARRPAGVGTPRRRLELAVRTDAVLVGARLAAQELTALPWCSCGRGTAPRSWGMAAGPARPTWSSRSRGSGCSPRTACRARVRFSPTAPSPHFGTRQPGHRARLRVLALRVVAAGDERAEAAFPLEQLRRAADRTLLARGLRFRLLLLVERLGIPALRVSRAAEEPPVPIPPDRQLPATVGTRTCVRGDGVADDLAALRLPLGEPALERRVEVLEDDAPVQLTLLDPVELRLHAAGEVHAEDVGKHVDEDRGDGLAQRCGLESLLLELHVLAVRERGDDLGVRGGPADPEPLELLDQARLREARRRLREVLRRDDLVHVAAVPLRQLRQRIQIVERPVVPVLPGLLVEAGKPVEDHDGAGGRGIAGASPGGRRQVDAPFIARPAPRRRPASARSRRWSCRRPPASSGRRRTAAR
jgi:hypothetical protein